MSSFWQLKWNKMFPSDKMLICFVQTIIEDPLLFSSDWQYEIQQNTSHRKQNNP